MSSAFHNFKLRPEVTDAIDSMGFKQATPVQTEVIPKILEGKDVIACAQTGTGKTAAYLLPILSHLIDNPQTSNHIRTLVIVPTRELAMQIDQQVQGFGYFTPISSINVYGGGDGSLWDVQKRAVIKGAEIVIATPGRLFAHMNLGYVDLSHLEILVLDEADKMLDMGFFEDIMKIVGHLPKKRQTLLFSATMPDNIRKLSGTILHKPEQISIAVSKPAENILQATYSVEDNQKTSLIRNLLENKQVNSTLVFSSTKKNVKALEKELRSAKMSVKAIHSDLEQPEREQVLREFKNGKVKILIATDIISRGIDIENIELVINYDVPSDAEDYVHRIGRTARAESDGVAITLVNRMDRGKIFRIEKLIEKKIFQLPLPDLS